MGPKKLKPAKKGVGPMDGFLTRKPANQNGRRSEPSDLQPVAEPREELPSSSRNTSPLAQSRQGSSPTSSNPLDRQGEEPHGTHNFEWSLSGDNKATTVSCNKAGTVEDVLKRSSQFRDISEKNLNKELVIMKDGKAISSHFPCCLIKNNERLTVKYVKAVQNANPVNSSVQRKRKQRSGELVMFNLLTKGGKDVVNIMTNSTLTKIPEMTVYAYKDENVKQALRRDGRLLDIVFTKNCVLSHTSSEVITEMSSLVDDLDGKSFKIILLNRKNPPESLPESLELDDMQNESQIIDPSGDQAPPKQSTTNGSLNENTKPETNPKCNMAPGSMLREIPNSKEMKGRLLAQFQHLVKAKKTQKQTPLSRIQRPFRVDYGKNVQTCNEVKTMKKLMDLSNSVCHVRINGRSGGSGFLLFGKCVLTNGHVIKGIYNESENQLTEKVTVHFSYESLGQVDPGATVEEVVGFEVGCDVSGHTYDWALLRLCADQELPDVLLKHFRFLPQRGGICIIGHPMGAVKKIDPCLIVPREGLNQVVERHQAEYSQGPIQFVTHQFFDGVKENIRQQPKTLLYESCFYHGSSGSPVFDEHCNVVAMHSGGYEYTNGKDEIQSVIEFGYPLSDITELIVIQMVQRGRFDVLKEYLDCDHAHQQRVMRNLKNLVEGRNIIAFKNGVNDSLLCNDEGLKKFFEFFSQVDEPVPMDICN
ncbi:serine protease FAM111A-like isoform X1 [Pseudochaenichthys georgianus]|uniref:serine protease FAM111A-like isoform X1 n=1 Tax=Pseudochaenichthys georgianus TaxID=52239 RepID=UPI00146DA968|nr:protein FAM111A-like isoform X1 [Pseudochaenichthys georgianus]XP_033955618.1 protein FAM111A-like isoform X1 [Pseudochaenichthys georgianus]